MSDKKIFLTFAGGARSVTGSNFLLEVVKGDHTTRILVDCGLEQGKKFCESSNREPFSYDPASVDAVFFTHAHADHIGLFPKLVEQGFKGSAYATPPTASLMPLMLEDAVALIAKEAKACDEEPPFTADDVHRAVALLEPIEYKKKIFLTEGISATLYNAGHILVSATILFDIEGTRVLFTGDLGRNPAILLPDADTPEGPIDYLITESVYGNRQHEDALLSEGALLRRIQRTVKERGTLLIPSFSLERTQIILSAIDRFVASGAFEPVPVFLDSPLAIRVTDVYRQFPSYLRGEIQERIAKGDDPFDFPKLHISYTPEDSAKIDELPSPKIIIAGAGMSHGGRIRNHERTYLPDRNAALLLVGYQTPGSLGRRLQDGEKKVLIDKKWVKVRANISKVGGFSAHADRDDLVSFAEKVKPKKAFVVLGELESSAFLAQRLSGFLGIDTYIPQKGEQVDL